MIVFINNSFCEEQEAKISVLDHGLLYGDGVFEGLRIYNGKIFRLDKHIDRLYKSAKVTYLSIPMNKEEMKDMLHQLIALNHRENGYIRLLVTRGTGTMGIDPNGCSGSNVIALVTDIQMYPSEYYKSGIELTVSSYRRISSECLDVRVKSLNYINNILAKIEAENVDCSESVMLNANGYVTECTADNIFIIKNNVVKTPAVYHGALEGITRGAVLELSDMIGLQREETALTRYDLYDADECFITGTAAEIVPVSKIDKISIGNGETGKWTKIIISKYREMVL